MSEVIEIVFGVAGGSNISGESGARIKRELEQIAAQISLKIDIDKNYFASQLNTLKGEINKTLNGSVKLGTGAGVKGSVSEPTQQSSLQSQNQQKLRSQLEQIYKLKSQINKLDGAGTVNETLKKSQVDRMTERYREQRSLSLQKQTITQQEASNLTAYEAQLEQSLQAERQTLEVKKQQNNLDMQKAKLANKSQALVSNNSEILKRSKKANLIANETNAKVVNALAPRKDKKGVLLPGIGADEVRALNQEVIEADTNIKKIGSETDTLRNNFKRTFRTSVLQSFSYALIGIATRALRQVYTNVVAIDKAVTDLQIATGKTRAQTVKLVQSYSDLAKQLGATVTEITSAADTWLRQGYAIEQVNTLITNTMYLSKLGQIESAEASKALTSAMKGYKVSVEDSIKIIDKFTAVDMEAAVSAGNIATAMAETAASADLSGVSMDKLIGYISTVAEVTQDGAESVGTFYKTMFARMGNVKAGKFVDDETGEALNDVEKVLNNVGISLRSSSNTFRYFGDVLDEVGKKWDTYNDVQKHALATAFAGTRQQEKFNVLMSNYGKALEYANVAANSGGTAETKYNEAYLDSITAKTNTLTALWQTFSSNLLDSNLVKVILDIVNALLTVVDWVISFGNGFIVNSAIAVGAVLLVRLAINKLVLSTGLGTAAIGVLGKAFSRLSIYAKSSYAWMAILNAVMLTLKDEVDNNAKKWIGFGAVAVVVIRTIVVALKKAKFSNPIGWILLALEGLVIGFVSLAKAGKRGTLEDLKKQLSELRGEVSSLKDDVKESNDELEKNYARMAELIKFKRDNSITLAQEKELELLKQQTAQLERQKRLKETELKTSQRKLYETARETYEKYTKENAEHYKSVTTHGTVSMNHSALEYIVELREIVQGLEYTADAIIGTQEASINALIEQVWEAEDVYYVACGKFGEVWETLISRLKFKNAVEELEKLADGGNMTSDAIKGLVESNPEVAKLVEYLTKIGMLNIADADSLQAFVNRINAMKEDISDINEELVKQANNLAILKKYVDEFSKPHSIFGKIEKDIEKIGVISADTIGEIYDEHQGLIEYLEETENGYILVTDAYNRWKMAQLKDKSRESKTKAGEHRNSYDSFVNGKKEAMLDKAIDLRYQLLGGVIDEKKYEDELSRIVREYEKAVEDELDATNEKIQKLIDDGANDYKLAKLAFDLLEREELIEKYSDILEKEEETIEERSDKYKELIEIRNKLLETYADEIKYQDELAKKQKKVADLETQVAIAKLDKSASGQAKLRELQSELDESKEDLKDFELDKAVEDITKSIEESQRQYEKFIASKLDDIKEAIENINKLSTAEIRSKVGESGSSTVPEYNGATNGDLINGIAGVSKDALETELEKGLNGKSTLNVRRFKESGKAGSWTWRQDIYAEDYEKDGVFEDEQGNKYVRDFYGDPNDFFAIDELASKPRKTTDEWGDDMYTFLPKGGQTKYRMYHSGGFVDDVTQLKSNEAFAKLLKGEFVSTPSQMDNFIKNTLPNLVNNSNVSAIINNNTPLIEIKCGNIDDDSMPQLKDLVNRAVEKIEQNMKNALGRTGYRK